MKDINNTDKIFSFIGHKPKELGGFDEENDINKWVKFSIKLMVGKLTKSHGNLTFLCGGMPGSEIWAAEEIIHIKSIHPERNTRIEIVLPFANITGRDSNGNPTIKKPWPLKSHERFLNVCNQADRVNTLSTGDYAAWRIRSRDEWVIDNSDGVVVVMKGDTEDSNILHAVEYASKQTVPVCVIDPVTEQIYTL